MREVFFCFLDSYGLIPKVLFRATNLCWVRSLELSFLSTTLETFFVFFP